MSRFVKVNPLTGEKVPLSKNEKRTVVAAIALTPFVAAANVAVDTAIFYAIIEIVAGIDVSFAEALAGGLGLLILRR